MKSPQFHASGTGGLHSIPGGRCDGFARRDFIHLGLLTSFGLTLGQAFRLQASAGLSKAPAKSCILIWLDGGPSHIDSFDPKPDAPGEIRSPFKSIPTTLPGVHLCEHLPKTAQVLSDVALIRSITHELGNHDTGSRFMLTGHRPTPAIRHPSLGSLMAHQARKSPAMPSYIAIPDDRVGGDSNAAGPGYLRGAFSAFNVGRDPTRVRDLHPPESVNFSRSDSRRDMLRRVDSLSREVEEGAATADRDAYYEQAYRLMASPEAKAAFDLGKESGQVRASNGSSLIGSGCLLARRLVESGARFITVVDTGWDTHQQISSELPDSRFPGSGKLPSLDRAYASLITDLKQRGLLESTLVVLMGEFGRTPKINAVGGRDHWPRAGFACLAGGGVRGGQVIGSTNTFGELPSERPVSPPDLAVSILQLLGIDSQKELVTSEGRPMKIMAQGEFVKELM